MVEFCDTDSIKPGSEKLARALLRVTLSTQLLKLRRVYKFVRYQPIRDQLKDALGAKYLKGADGAADSEAGFVFQTESGDVGVGHVKELCRQIEQLVVQLGPLCGLLALYACFEPDGESARLGLYTHPTDCGCILAIAVPGSIFRSASYADSRLGTMVVLLCQ
jgi:hypothetical protein